MDNQEFYDFLDEEERTTREATRSAVVLAKIRYDEQVAPFVKNSATRLQSNLVQTELERIVKECSEEVGADPVSVWDRFTAVLADVVLPVTEPERVNVKDLPDSYPPGGFSDEVPEAQATTDVKDNGVVLEDEILNPGKMIEVQGAYDPNASAQLAHYRQLLLEAQQQGNAVMVQMLSEKIKALMSTPGLESAGWSGAPGSDFVNTACFRCASAKDQDAPLCTDCEAHVLLEAGVTPDFLARTAAPYQAQPNSQQQQGVVGPQQPLTPLNPNSPYQCNVCGFTGTFHDVQAHLNSATDTQHMQAKQQQQNQPAQPPQYGQQPPQGPQYGQQTASVKEGDANAYYDNIHDDANRGEGEEAARPTSPERHFEHVVQVMANRAAARALSTPDDDKISKIADAYGLDPQQVKSALFITANFGEYAYTNGKPGQQPAPEGYVPLNLDGTQGEETGHEVVVPVTAAIRRAAQDLGMDENTVYSSVKDNMGADLSDEYHATAKGQYTMYVPSSLLDQATNHPQPDQPQGQQPPAPQAPPQGGGGAPGSPVETMQPVSPMQPSAHYLGKPLDQTYLDWLLARDEEIASRRMASRGYIKLR